jgi:hypothetical protein
MPEILKLILPDGLMTRVIMSICPPIWGATRSGSNSEGVLCAPNFDPELIQVVV